MAAPDPGALLLVMIDLRLRIVNDYKIVIQKIARAVFVDHLLENLFFDAGEIDLATLERVVHFFCNREEIRRSLNNPLFGAQTEAVPKQRECGKRLRHAAAVVSGIEVRYPQAL